jgi:enterochelin esterase-like enzyme
VSDIDLSGKKVGRKIEAHTFFSQYLHEDRTIKVFLPPEYDAMRSYPVMYCHDGLEFFTHGRIATIANQLILDGKLEPMLVAGIAVSKTNRTDDYGIRGSRHDAYCRFVANECLATIEETYNINSEKRLMAGISLGGTVSVSLSLQYPHLFSNLLLFSGAFFPSVREHVKKTLDLSYLHAYMVVGKQETEVETSNKTRHDFYGYNQQMLDILRTRKADVTYKEADGTHIWGFWQKELPEALIYANQLIR